jgi:acetyl-CoA decarbonylase/synthase complex subunit gamma
MWILVPIPKALIVGCAAGKGTFGTKEVGPIESGGWPCCLPPGVDSPQLSGPGVAATRSRNYPDLSHLRTHRSKDLPAFLENGHKATPEMRQKTFNLWERAAVIPVELVAALKSSIMIIPLFFIISFLAKSGVNHGLYACLALLISILSGAVLTPLLLPWVPGRAFSLKGLSLEFWPRSSLWLWDQRPALRGCWLSYHPCCIRLFLAMNSPELPRILLLE